MTWRALKDRWTEVSEAAALRWNRLTARDLHVIAGNRERLIGILQQRYGAHRRTIDREVRVFTRSLLQPTARDTHAQRSEAATVRAS